MSRLILLTIALAAIGRADFHHLVTTDNGDQVFFVTSLRQTGSDQTPRQKVFALDDGHLDLLFETGPGLFTTPFVISGTSVAGDGSLVAFDVRTPCVGGSSCFLRELSTGYLFDGVTGTQTTPGPHVRISRNARFALTWSSSGAMGGNPPAITDRLTGETTTLERGSRGGGNVASDGSVLTGSFQSLIHLRPSGDARYLAPPDGAAWGFGRTSLSDSGIATYETTPQRHLFVLDLATMTSVRLGPDTRESYGASLSTDGEWVLYVSVVGETPQLFFSRTDGSVWRQLTTSAEGVAEAALSGDGHVAWASTLDGRLFKIDTLTGETAKALAPPALGEIGGRVVPGSLLHLHGSRLGNRVRINGREAPVYVADEENVFVQAPWDLPPPEEHSRTAIVSVGREDSPLEAVTPEFALNYGVFFPNAFVPPIHGDWSGFVTPENPARPGEVIHIYAVGLGPVDCHIETGEPAPLNRFCRPTTALEWDYWWTSTDSMPAEVYFTGLAPGLVGLYQIEARVPLQPPASRLKLIANRFGFYVVADFMVK